MSLDKTRGQLGALRVEKQRAQVDERRASLELSRLRRTLGEQHGEVKKAEAAHAAAVAVLDRVRGAEKKTRAELAAGINEWVRTQRDEVASLEADVPIVMFPVRLETRFSVESSELRIRVYPDVLSADAFDAALTERERAFADDYWRTAWDPSREAEAWAGLLTAMKPARAAWIVRALSPENLAERPEGAPSFPQTETRPDTWSRAVETRLLPDRWIAVAHRDGGEVARKLGPVIVEPLALTLAPDAKEDELVELAPGLKVDAEFLWTLDFAKAEEAGMALRLALSGEDLKRGFDRLVVVGVKSSLSADRSGAELARLFEAQHYSRGMALLGQGTPTNNTGLAPAGYPPPSDAAYSFAIERGEPLTRQGSDGTLLAGALGVPTETLSHIDGAGRGEQRAAAAMARALWPATLGYYLEQMMAPAASADLIRQVRRHFEEHVRGRGPLPALRAGSTPYAVLPVSSLRRWAPARGARGLDVSLPELLRNARNVWLRLAEAAPRVGTTNDPDADLLSVLGMDAAPREVRLRQVLGPAYRLNLAHLFGLEIHDPALDPPLLDELGLTGLDARVLRMAFANVALRFRHPFVTAEPLSEELGLSTNYIRSIRQSSLLNLFHRRLRGNDNPWPLLARMLRHGALTEYNRVALELELAHGLAQVSDAREVELVGIVAGTSARPTVAERFQRTIPALTGSLSLGEYLGGPLAPSSAVAYRAALAELEPLPTAELERLLRETLGVCSNRLDAWISSLASKRLGELRRARPLASHVGAYGWVEDLRPRDRRAPQGGFVHAPSMAHAATAAVLRNAHLTRRGEARAQVAIDLSSQRVRMALRLLDGVRAGQPLGALLGYRFERALHDRGLDVYIERFRRLYPLALDPTTAPEEPSESLPARDVVDGLSLRVAWLDDDVPFGEAASGLPAPGSTEFDVLDGVLRILDDEVDATADLLLAESVYQGIQGQVDNASTALSAVAAGARPPEPEVVRSPRGGIPITHRVVVAIGAPPASSSWSAPATARALAEPRLDAWAGTLLGDPATVRARIGPRIVTLAELALRPLDVLALEPAELETRIRWSVRHLPEVDRLELRFERDASWDPLTVRTFPEILELARTIRELVNGCRPLEGRDLVQAGSTETAWDLAELTARASAARGALEAARGALDVAASTARSNPASDLTPLRLALLRVAEFGIQALPATVADSSAAARAALLEPVTDILATATRRIAAANASEALQALRELFGESFAILPLLTPPNATELTRALAHEPALTGDRFAGNRWLERTSRVRPSLGRLRMAALLAEPLGGAETRYEVVQLPHADNGRWAALPFVDERRPSAGTLSLVLSRAFDPTPTQKWAGLAIDEWLELIPSDVQSTGIAVHHDRPGSEAPQALLLAVPPAESGWNLATLLDVVHETLDLAKIRSVDVDLLGDVARLLPGVYLAGNVADDTVSTPFADAVAADVTISAFTSEEG